jgi:hypothetical protein
VTNVALVARKLAILEEHLLRLRARRPEAFTVLERHGILDAELVTPWRSPRS